MVKFLADSSADLRRIDGVDFESVPLTISTDHESWLDTEQMDIHGMMDTLAKYKGRSYTACPSVEAWLNAFGEADTLYIITMTSGLSGTYNSAMVARSIYLGQHPEAQVRVFDTLSAGPEPQLVAEKAAELHLAGLSFQEVCAGVEEFMAKSRLFFAFQSLHNFAQNGRVSKAAAAAVGLLNIRVVGTASADGKVEPIAKARGDRAALIELMHQMETLDYTPAKLRVGHCENRRQAEALAQMLKNRYPSAEISIYEAGGICSYYGERGGLFLGVGPE